MCIHNVLYKWKKLRCYDISHATKRIAKLCIAQGRIRLHTHTHTHTPYMYTDNIMYHDPLFPPSQSSSSSDEESALLASFFFGSKILRTTSSISLRSCGLDSLCSPSSTVSRETGHCNLERGGGREGGRERETYVQSCNNTPESTQLHKISEAFTISNLLHDGSGALHRGTLGMVECGWVLTECTYYLISYNVNTPDHTRWTKGDKTILTTTMYMM